MTYDPRIHPQVVQMLEAGRLSGIKRISELSVADARKQYHRLITSRSSKVIDVGPVRNFFIAASSDSIPVRLYKPKNYKSLEPIPLLIYFHGGGHVIGSLETHDSICRRFCEGASCGVLSVDYRLAPEFPFPAAINDAIDTLFWAKKNANTLGVDPYRIAVGGDSAGGNLAAALTLLVRDREEANLCFQLLIYPVLDMTFSSKSHKEFSNGFGILDTETDMWFRSHYIPDQSMWTNFRASPIFASSHERLPETFLVLAELDLLYSEGVAYHNLLLEAGNKSELKVFPGMIHGFITAIDNLELARQAQLSIIKKLVEVFSKDSLSDTG